MEGSGRWVKHHLQLECPEEAQCRSPPCNHTSMTTQKNSMFALACIFLKIERVDAGWRVIQSDFRVLFQTRCAGRQARYGQAEANSRVARQTNVPFSLSRATTPTPAPRTFAAQNLDSSTPKPPIHLPKTLSPSKCSDAISHPSTAYLLLYPSYLLLLFPSPSTCGQVTPPPSRSDPNLERGLPRKQTTFRLPKATLHSADRISASAYSLVPTTSPFISS